MKDAILARLEKVKRPDKNGEYLALCPFHDDHNPSLSVNFDKGTYNCFGCQSSGPISRLAERLGVNVAMKAERQIEATYDYTEAEGKLLFQTVRYSPKDFSQRRPDGAGGWVHDLKSVKRVLYHVPEVLEVIRRGEVVYVCEGEKDADNLRKLGLVATTNPLGAGKWRPEYSETLTGANVVILPDKDDAGRKHAQQVTQSLAGKAKSIKVVELPGLPDKGDVTDWLHAGGTRAELERLDSEAKPLSTKSEETDKGSQEPLSGSEVLDEVVTFVRRFVVLSSQQAHALALWTAHTYSFEAAETTPYIHVTSPEKRSGKTRVLEVEEVLVKDPWFTGRVTPAVLARKIDAECPDLLLDETDAAFGGDKEYAETLRGILNTGHRRGGKTSVCSGQGANITYKDLSTFCPKAIAGIGKLPDTVADRSIAIVLKRRTAAETVEHFRHRKAESDAATLRERLSAWASTLQLHDVEPSVPDELDDRAADCWEPLLAIADAAGGEWPQRAREAAVALSGGTGREDASLGVRLLADIKTIFTVRKVERIRSAELVPALNAIEEAPWSNLDKRPLDASRLAKLLDKYEIRPKTVRLDEDTTAKGYDSSWFADAWERYVPASSGVLAVTPVTLSTADAQESSRNMSVEPERDVTPPVHAQPTFDVTPVTANSPEKQWGALVPDLTTAGRGVREII